MFVRVEPTVSATVLDDGGLVLLCERTGRLHRGNATAATMWAALRDHEGCPDSAARAVADYYGIHLDRVRADLDALVGELSRAGLLGVEP